LEKTERLKKLSNPQGVIAALAIDQRKSVRNPIAALRGVPPEQVTDDMLSEFKACISRVLSPHATAVLIDPEYGMDAVKAASRGTGLLLTYEMDGLKILVQIACWRSCPICLR
jgi:tagatose 1,6-diphosphate aldolase